ncbi:hypothetical protein GCM10007857_76770 [Bradyrhizobium iriomotense]|uniref:Uncharacterized protein n=1 Tax=Bradyrhizobium iriomotense TaxID=441950 RepID=A0ABQ6BBT5_9BRAD|nr:hypothetical protein GCM10007857_76770 [Bradyrhizobium iriomotense]
MFFSGSTIPLSRLAGKTELILCPKIELACCRHSPICECSAGRTDIGAGIVGVSGRREWREEFAV